MQQTIKLLSSPSPTVVSMHVGFPLSRLRAAKALFDRAYPHPLRFGISYHTRDGTLATTTNMEFLEAYARTNAHAMPPRASFDAVLHAGDAFMRVCPRVNLCEPATYRRLVAAYYELAPYHIATGYTERGRVLLEAAYSGRTERVLKELEPDVPPLPLEYYAMLLAELFALRATCVPYVVARAMFIPETKTLLLGLAREDGHSPHLTQVALGPRGIVLQRPTYEYHYVSGPGRGMSTAQSAAPTRSMQHAFDTWAADPRSIAIKLMEPIFSLGEQFAYLALCSSDDAQQHSFSFAPLQEEDDMQVV